MHEAAASFQQQSGQVVVAKASTHGEDENKATKAKDIEAGKGGHTCQGTKRANPSRAPQNMARWANFPKQRDAKVGTVPWKLLHRQGFR